MHFKHLVPFLLIASGIFWAQTCRNSVEPLLIQNQPDTTSHNITWHLYQLGDGASSILYDCVVFNDTLAYAVGEINKKDSAGNWLNPPYNLAKWDGQQWSLETVLYPYQGQQFFAPLHSILAFSPDDFWVGSNQPMHWNGSIWQTYDLPATIWNGWINRIWGHLSTEIYIVGNAGSFAHYSGSWSKIASSTSLDIQDIYGATDANTGQEQILAVGTRNTPLDRVILSIQGNVVTQVSSTPIQGEIFGLWFTPNNHYYVVGDGIFEKRQLSDNTWNNDQLAITKYATTKICANGLNDVFVVGAFGECLHWNGSSWLSYLKETGLANGSYNRVVSKGNLIVAVGYNSPYAVVAIGKR